MEELLLDDFTKYKYLSSLILSPNAGFSAFISNIIDEKENTYNSSIYILNNNDSTCKKILSLKKLNNLVWRDEKTIFFSADSEEDKERRNKKEPFTCFYEMNIFEDEPKKLFELSLNINSIKLLDNDKIAFTATFDPRFSGFLKLDKEDRVSFLENIKEEDSFEILDEIPFWSNGEGFTNKIRNKLYIYDIESEEISSVTDDFTDVYEFKIDKGHENIVLISNSYIDKQYSHTELQTYNIENDSIIKISPYTRFKYMYADFLEDKIIFFGSNMNEFGINQNPDFYTCNLDGRSKKKISKDNFNYSITNSIGSDCRYGKSILTKVDGGFLYFVTTEGDSSFIKKIDIGGNIKKLTFRKGSIDSIDVVDGKLQFIGLRSLRLQEVYKVEDKKEFQITDLNQWVMDSKTLSIPEKLTFRNEEDTLIEGWVMKPTNFKAGKDYPGVLSIHGGPKTAYGEVYFHEMQYLANQGYVVFFCNPRGSDGRGDKFADIRGKYGTIDYDDIMLFTDLVLEKYAFIDEKRLGVMGGSYGGFMTNWIIGHTNRFKAAISQRSISNWISKFGTTDIGYYFVEDQIDGTPWEDFEKIWKSSPMKYADKVITPTLFIHSQEDYRCSLAEAIQMFTSLKYHGVESRLCMFKEENHELSRSGKPKNRIKRLSEIKDWFERYLK